MFVSPPSFKELRATYIYKIYNYELNWFFDYSKAMKMLHFSSIGNRNMKRGVWFIKCLYFIIFPMCLQIPARKSTHCSRCLHILRATTLETTIRLLWLFPAPWVSYPRSPGSTRHVNVGLCIEMTEASIMMEDLLQCRGNLGSHSCSGAGDQ